MSTLLLVRHGLTALTGPVLSGRTPDVHLDERGIKQAAAVAARIAALPVTAIVTSPLDRCVETAEAIRAAQATEPTWAVDERIIECGYGDWTGKALKDLAKDPVWKVVQTQPSAARFPNGESLTEVSARAVSAVRDWDARLGDDAIWVACSHGDVIKAILADALGPAPRPVPADRRRPVLGLCGALHRHPAVRAALERRGRRSERVRAAQEKVAATQVERRRGRRWRRQRRGLRRDRTRRLEAIMPRQFFLFERPSRFVAGTVGDPGDRTFFLQATDGTRVISVALEKQQVEVLADRLEQLLDEVVARTGTALPASDSDTAALELPIDEEFRVSAMGLAWDGDAGLVVIEAQAPVEDADRRRGDAARRRRRRAGRTAGAPRTDPRTRLRRTGPPSDRCRPPAVPTVRAAARPGRACLPAPQRLPPNPDP